MPTHAELSARLLRDAPKFFKSVGQQNPDLKTQMEHNAVVFENVATLVEADPTGVIEDENGTPSAGP